MDGLSRLDAASAEEARADLLRCCGASRWVEAMLARRPFGGEESLLHAADESFASLDDQDWLEAFGHHPRIGDLDSLRAKFAATQAWAAGEQAGAAAASEAVLQALADGNRDYEMRFHHIFIVCATGKGAEEMLALLRQRLPNPPEVELRIAAAEQAKITRLRLSKLIAA
jgi:2-oxo-4-hydroxy-4-carboxy-5-ureidoimidazoline decarboxylase